MQSRTVEQVESWDARPFSGGLRELHELADDDFSGTVTADDTWVFFLNGRVIGVFQGDIEEVRDASGTIYTAPDPSLPLLFTMQERGGTTQAKYFTNDTPIEEADKTLRDANFTGYLELSENVLSGDYYISYYGGKSMSTAFVGQSERLEVGDEAFEMANDEVGVFEVRKVSMNITELPAIQEDDAASGAAGASDVGAAGAATAGASSASTEDEETADIDDETASVDSEPEPEPDESEAPSRSPVTVEEAEPTADAGDDGAVTDERPAEQDDEPSIPGAEPSAADEPATDPPAEEPTAADQEAMSDHERAVREWAAKDRSERDEATNQDLFREEAEWRKTKSIPALDPDESSVPGSNANESAGESSPKARTSQSKGATGADRTQRRTREPRPSRAQQSTPTDAESPAKSEGDGAQLAKLEAAVEERNRRIESLESELSEATSRREELEADVAELRDERDQLQERVDSLEAELEAAESAGASAGTSSQNDIGPDEALSGTNLFVRYDSKGKPTLESLQGSSVDPDAVNENLRLDHHTQFDEEETTVEGTPFGRFLRDSSRYRFVDWLVRALPYELLDSSAISGLQDVYEAIPDFDRVEFEGTVDVESESGETVVHGFDVVIRDRMGEPLVVADMNDSRDPVQQESMESLVTGATDLGATVDSLAGAFYVTASYFEPGALERAQEAASAGGFFSRSDRRSYVKVSRKNGYHLCLVEDRRDAFHLTVPEL